MLMGGAILASLGGSAVSITANAQALAPQDFASGVNFTDASAVLDHRPVVQFSRNQNGEARFAALNRPVDAPQTAAPRALELELAAPHDVTGIPLDLSIAQRASFEANSEGDLNRQGRGAEVRIGRAFGDRKSVV